MPKETTEIVTNNTLLNQSDDRNYGDVNSNATFSSKDQVQTKLIQIPILLQQFTNFSGG